MATGAAVAPGAQLHILAIGISEYSDKSLHLDFAASDAKDVANALLISQGSGPHKGLYAEVHAQYLPDRQADKAAIFNALWAIKDKMAKGGDQDLAVIFFSGHGVTIDDRFFLLPYDVNFRTPAQIKGSAILANRLNIELERR